MKIRHSTSLIVMYAFKCPLIKFFKYLEIHCGDFVHIVTVCNYYFRKYN